MIIQNQNSIDLNLAEERYGAGFVQHAVFARNIASLIDQDPYQINNYINEPSIKFLCSDNYKSSWTTLDRTLIAEALSYGDAGVYMACPNPGLAGGVIREVANDVAMKRFFDFVEKNRCTTFAAITEPEHGSDVASIESKVEKVDTDRYKIIGEKLLITHGADGKIGVVIGRVAPGPFGIVIVLVTDEELKRGELDGTIQRELLPIIGLKGTFLSRIKFDNFIVPSQNILGQHLKASQRGMMAIIKTFNRMRPTVAGFVLGQAQGLVDYISTCYKPISQSLAKILSTLNADIASARESLYESARLIDADPMESSYVSLVKAQITHLIEHVCYTLVDEISIGFFCEQPLLLKWLRDVYGFEYMEGTTNMQKRNVYQKHLKFARTLK